MYMKIKDVEKLTGLTAKSIRYYESKGLLEVGRNEENSYREYSEEHVIRLRKIKLFRYLDFSIEEIAEFLDKDDKDIKEIFRDKAEFFSNQKDANEAKQEICLTLAKEYEGNPETISEYSEEIDVLESEEMDEVYETLRDYACPNLSYTIMLSLVLLGPILWLFINIMDEKWDELLNNAVWAIVGTVLLTANWIHYFTYRSRHKNQVKKNNKEFSWMWPGLIITLIVSFVAMMGFSVICEILLVPEDFLFYQHHPVAEAFMVPIIMIPIVLVIFIIMSKSLKKSLKEMEDLNGVLVIWNKIGKLKPIVIILWVIGLYCCMTNMTIVTEDEIIYCTPLHPKGITYAYSDVESIKTGFGDKTYSFVYYKRKGNFYYQIELDDKVITFNQPTANANIKRYDEDTYLELEEFDQAMMSLGIPKESSDKGYKNCDLAQRYVDRFLRIIELK